MGDAEDDEPPLKRSKQSSGEPGGPSNGEFLRELGGRGPLSGSMARLPTPQGDSEVVGPNGNFEKVEFVRVIAETLNSFGYSKTVKSLEEESETSLYTTEVKLFMQQILNGQWDESLKALRKIGIMDENIIKCASFVILEYKFFELLDGEKHLDALETLRSQISPLCINVDRVRELSSTLISPTKNSLEVASSHGLKLKSREMLLEELRKLLPPAVIVPKNRLMHLFAQAFELQRYDCKFHNSTEKEISLCTDHLCGRSQIPSHTLQILQEHCDEVWFLQFSHNGKYLASSSSDGLVVVWEVKVEGLITLKHRLLGHQRPVSYISWSPDDNQLLTCGEEETVKRWDVSSGECLTTYKKSGLGLVSCGWALDGMSIFSGVTDKSISMWNLEGQEVKCWKGKMTTRIADLGICSDGREIIMICEKRKRLMFYGWKTKSTRFIYEDYDITSFALSKDKKFLLVNLVTAEVHLWKIDELFPSLVGQYSGHKHKRYLVRSCLGGVDEAFIASGSENAQVYVWGRKSEELIMKLVGHRGAVNCVSWNPTNPHMLASASDDHTIRIWGRNRVDMDNNGRNINSVCIGGT